MEDTVSFETREVGIHGLNCPNCAAKVERGVRSLNGVRHVDVMFDTETGVVTYDPDTVSLECIAHVVEDTGCDSSQFTLSVDGRRVRPGRTGADTGEQLPHDRPVDDPRDEEHHSPRAPF